MKQCAFCVVLVLAALAGFGCAKKKEITSLERKQAAALASEAQFAATLRDYPRAEGLLAQATVLCPDDGSYWISLGSVRARIGQKDGARDAYKRSLKVFEQIAKDHPTDTGPRLQQVYVLALLGRVDDARAMEAKLLKAFPNDRNARAFVENKQLDRVMADPLFKQISL